MPVTIGVDPHKASHTAAALDEDGRLLGRQHIPGTIDGYRLLRQWAVRWPDRCWAVKGAHGIGRALAQRLVGDGEQVVDVPAKLAARVRVLSVGHGRKSDPDDAVSVVVAARNARGLRQVRVEDQAVVLHLWTKRRQDLVAARTQTINRLHRLLIDLIPGGTRRNLTANRAAALLAPQHAEGRDGHKHDQSPHGRPPPSLCCDPCWGARQPLTLCAPIGGVNTALEAYAVAIRKQVLGPESNCAGGRSGADLADTVPRCVASRAR
jgi:hypothetical protein